jgi:hypothetical protein
MSALSLDVDRILDRYICKSITPAWDRKARLPLAADGKTRTTHVFLCMASRAINVAAGRHLTAIAFHMRRLPFDNCPDRRIDIDIPQRRVIAR